MDDKIHWTNYLQQSGNIKTKSGVAKVLMYYQVSKNWLKARVVYPTFWWSFNDRCYISAAICERSLAALLHIEVIYIYIYIILVLSCLKLTNVPLPLTIHSMRSGYSASKSLYHSWLWGGGGGGGGGALALSKTPASVWAEYVGEKRYKLNHQCFQNKNISHITSQRISCLM